MFSEKGAVYEALPQDVKRELFSIALSRRCGLKSFSELHLSVGRRSSVLSFGERIYLGSQVRIEEMEQVVKRLCQGAVYAFRDTITDGYITVDGGVRVGVCGHARYEGDRLVGISDITSLVFRIPTQSCSVSEELLAAWESTERGLLIFAKAGGGKTTALRTLVSLISSGKSPARVAVVDERCEFSREECARLGVDLLRGYKRSLGIEIALRSLAPDVIVIDEIGARGESDAMVDSMNSGVKIMATAHASGFAELAKRSALTPFFKHDIFDTFVGIFNTDGIYRSETRRGVYENA